MKNSMWMRRPWCVEAIINSMTPRGTQQPQPHQRQPPQTHRKGSALGEEVTASQTIPPGPEDVEAGGRNGSKMRGRFPFQGDAIPGQIFDLDGTLVDLSGDPVKPSTRSFGMPPHDLKL
jgi:hypothetical protein